MISNLAIQHCIPCSTGGEPMPAEQARELAREVPSWKLLQNMIEREWKFADFRQALDFVNRVAAIAEEEGHHPDIFISYNLVRLTLFTHKVGGLTKNDFILAAKIDRLQAAG
jgi:4a-hydroxytetrahydrobiopterin dehydratase